MSSLVQDKTTLITLVGSPNSGKTTLFNQLSGRNFKTVNYPGATVEYSFSKLQDKFNLNANLLDSPGIISLTPHSPDEKIAVKSLFSHPVLGIPDLLIVTVDSSQLSRHLLLVKQLQECKFNLLVVLTMNDILEKKGFSVSTKNLSSKLNCEVVKTDGRTGSGLAELVSLIGKKLKENNTLAKNTPVPYRINENKESLLNYYKNIEIINDNVLEELPEKNTVNLKKANRQLRILHPDPIAKKNCYQIDQRTVKIDKILLHKFWGLIAFFLIMAITFSSIFWLAQPVMDFVSNVFAFLADEALALIGNNWFGDFISTGIITGVGSVMVFVPQIMILFSILGLLEDSGYLARGAMLIDKPLSKIGLNGKSFVPMLSGFACAIPAMMAARTIPNKRERLLTIFILPLLSCSARLPIYALLLAFLFPGNKAWIAGLVLAAIYIFSIINSVVVAAIINKFTKRIIKEEDDSSFILELPAYRTPKIKVVYNNMVTSAKSYLRKAGPVILVLSIAIWFLTSFPDYNPKVEMQNHTQDEIVQLKNSERLANSYASDMGKFIQPVMKPLGMDWRVGVSLIAAFTAREVFVSSLALIFKVTGDGETIQNSMVRAMNNASIDDTGQKLFTPATIAGLIVFFLFALQCLSTVAVSRQETGSWRIPILQLVIFTVSAYLLTFITVNGLRALGIA
ncbi:MAG TPA: ferrous iron transport protein B [Ignavibacteriaceae bacterium]|nr:ferrous iron transport protein B [Ignavibacteriaceae bacterium]